MINKMFNKLHYLQFQHAANRNNTIQNKYITSIITHLCRYCYTHVLVQKFLNARFLLLSDTG